jgi:hypothetical protein
MSKQDSFLKEIIPSVFSLFIYTLLQWQIMIHMNESMRTTYINPKLYQLESPTGMNLGSNRFSSMGSCFVE